MEKVRGDIRAGRWAPPNLTTMGELFDHYLDLKSVDVKASTLAGYRHYIRKHLKPNLGRMRVQDLSVAAINSLYAKLARGDHPLALRSRRQVAVILYGALELAVKEEMIGDNPARRANTPNTPAYRPPDSAWTLPQLAHFLNTAKQTEPDLYPLFAWLAWTGTRRGEALGLRYSAVDLPAARARIRLSRVLVDNRVTVTEPKTASGTRVIPLIDQLVTVLREWQRQQAARWLETGIRPTEDWVFTDRRGEPLHPYTVHDAFRRITRRAKLPHTRIHDLRHLWVRTNVEAGNNAKAVARAAGHKHVSFTLAAYYEPSEAEDQAFADRLGSALGSASGYTGS
jgi:integrase